MKKITLSFFLFFIYLIGFSQISIGNGTNESQSFPFDPFFGYSYTQSIYLSSEINASGDITGLQWYYSGTSLLTNNQELTIYLGHTTKTVFDGTQSTSWEPVSNLTAVYTGGIPVTGPGWVSITFDTPFTYNGTDNLIIAVDENMSGYNSSSDDFYNTSVIGNRSINYRSDSVNPDPSTPPTASLVASYVANVVLEGITESCPLPTDVTVINITESTADLSWTENGTSFDWEYVIQPVGTGAPTGSGLSVDLNPWLVADGNGITGLMPFTEYEIYFRSFCSFSDQSAWVGPVNFKTKCDVFAVPSLENFSTYVPDCWEEADNGDLTAGPDTYGTSGWVADGFGNNGSTGSARYEIWQATANDWLISPAYLISATGYELKFDAAVTQWNTSNAPTGPWESDDYVEVLISTTGTNNWTVLYTYNDTNVPAPTGTTNIIDLSAYVGQNVKIAFRVVEGTANGSTDLNFYVDNFEIRLTPINPPDCVTNLVATPDASCGNEATTITWDAVSGADGYKITIGTTSGGNDVLDNVDLGVNVTYDYIGLVNTNYFVTVTPYNQNGDAIACSEITFATNVNGCYCPSLPTSNDGNGISNVQLGATDFPTGDVFYFDHTGTTVDLAIGINSNVQITFVTGYTYDTNIWIDFNDNYVFEASELVKTGIASTNANPTTLDASFIMPASANLGLHRMRIATADSGQSTPNPCYSGTYGVTLDFNVNVVTPPCSPLTFASTTLANCSGTDYFIAIDVTNLGDGTPSISDGTTSWPVTATGVINVGPFALGTPISLTALHGSSAICDVPVGTYNYAVCPPANDDCVNAQVLIPGGVFADNAIVGTNVGASDSNETAPGCALYDGGDVWYQVTVPASGSLTFENNTQVGGITDSAGAVYSGSCGSLVLIDCDDSGSDGANDHPLITVSGRTPGEVLYYRVWEYNNDSFGEFQVSVYDASLSSSAFDLTGFKAYPNPVKNILNLEYKSNITSISVYNLLGQEVLSRTINATSTNVDMSQLNSGAYIVNVSIDGALQTIKVIKE